MYYNYPVAIEEGDSEHSFGVVFPDLPGCYSAGDTLDEALEQAREALEFHLEGLASQNTLAPKPSKVSDYVHNEEFLGHTWALVSIDPTPYFGKSEKVNVTLPTALTARIDNTIKTSKDFKNRSQFLQIAALKMLAAEDNKTQQGVM